MPSVPGHQEGEALKATEHAGRWEGGRVPQAGWGAKGYNQISFNSNLVS